MKTTFASNIIKTKRKELGLSQDNVAQYLGLTRISIINIENGRHGLKYDSVYKLCCLLNIQPNDLFPKIKPVKIKFITQTETKLVVKKVLKLNQ